jgi:hypothetical protein
VRRVVRSRLPHISHAMPTRWRSDRRPHRRACKSDGLHVCYLARNEPYLFAGMCLTLTACGCGRRSRSRQYIGSRWPFLTSRSFSNTAGRRAQTFCMNG